MTKRTIALFSIASILLLACPAWSNDTDLDLSNDPDAGFESEYDPLLDDGGMTEELNSNHALGQAATTSFDVEAELPGLVDESTKLEVPSGLKFSDLNDSKGINAGE